ncbi:MAG: MlaD family protein [Burkholderiaceae bacterium]
MDDKVNYTLVGAFVLVLGAALVAAVLWLAAGLSTKKKYEPYQVVVEESVAGLTVAAPVKYLGVDVGKVSTIAIDPENSRRVRVGFLIERGTPIKQDTEAVLKSQGLTGIAYFELSGGSPGSPALTAIDGAVPTILSKRSLSARLEDVLTTGMANLTTTAANLNAVLDVDNRAAFKQTLLDTATLMHALSAQQRTMTAAIADAAKTARNAAQASDRLGPAIQRIAASADAVARMADAVSRTSADAHRPIVAATGVLEQLKGGTLPEVERLTVELNALARSLRALSEQTERNPTSLLIGAPKRPLGPGEEAKP